MTNISANPPKRSNMPLFVSFRQKHFQYLLAVAIIIVNGCSSMLTDQFVNEAQRPKLAEAFFKQLDNEVAEAEVSHKAFARVDGFPYLRTNRYLVALKDRLDSPERTKAWLLAMQALDIQAREKEILTLPRDAVKRLSEDLERQTPELRQTLIQKMAEYSEILLNHDLTVKDLYPVLIKTTRVPDDYSIYMRTFGLYPLVMPVVAYFTDGAYDKMRDRNKIPLDEQKVHGKKVAYFPPKNSENRELLVAKIYATSNRDLFGLPLLTDADKLHLAEVFAPVFNHDVADTFDRLGAVEWRSEKLKINDQHPTVYFYYTAALFHGKPIIQINYVTWTAGRLGPNAPSIERGELDGITLRVSLDDSGQPFMVDGMNNCACYHFFIPDKDRLTAINPISWEFDAVVIDYLPPDFPKKPIALRVTSGWHQIEDVGTDLPFDKKEIYQLAPYHHLESIPLGQTEYASMFDHEGIGIGSDRIEIYIFFSMGIPRVGAMRQRGHHPTKLVGRAHFDDPWLLEKNFTIK